MYKYQKQLRVFPREFSLQIERCRTILVSRVTVRSRDTCDCHILFFLTEITHVAALTMQIRLWHIRETDHLIRNLIQIKLLNIHKVYLTVNWFYSAVECMLKHKTRPSPDVWLECKFCYFFRIRIVIARYPNWHWPCQRIISYSTLTYTSTTCFLSVCENAAFNHAWPTYTGRDTMCTRCPPECKLRSVKQNSKSTDP